MSNQSNHLRNAKYLGSMKPFSVSVSQDLLGMAKIGRVNNIHYSIIRIYHTFCFWIPKDCYLSTTNLPSFHFPRSIPAPYQCYGVPRLGREVFRAFLPWHQWLRKATNPSFFLGVTYGGFLKWWVSPTNPWVFHP